MITIEELLIFFAVCALGGGVVVAIKGIDGSGDLALFGGTAVAFIAAFTLSLVSLSHFLPPPNSSFSSDAVPVNEESATASPLMGPVSDRKAPNIDAYSEKPSTPSPSGDRE